MHEHPPRIALDEQLIQQFMDENPQIHVNYEVIPVSEYDLKLRTAMAAGSGPDLFNQWTAEIGQFYASDILAPLNAAAAGYADDAAVVANYDGGESLMAGIMFDDRLYGLPTEFSIYACYANDDLWAEAGLDPATDFPTTWEGLRDVAEQLTVHEDDTIVQRGFDFNWTWPGFMWLQFNPQVTQLGGYIVNDSDYSVAVDSPEVAQAMSYWTNWATEWDLGGPQYLGSRDAFLAGELAIECSFGNWGVPQMEEANINWSVHKAPRWEAAVNDNYLDLYAYYFMVNAQSDPNVQEAAWKLAGYLTSFPEEYFTEAGLFQSQVDFVNSDTFKNDPVMPIFLEQMRTSQFSPRIVAWNEVAEALAGARDRVVIGGEDLADVLPETDVEITRILERALADLGQ
ncbi:MAG: extracellular solute-binding protein [Caldilineaceae bacterium]|nr:extracellular solute-binding protein [Caldilineaceae bacterium]